MIKDCFDKELKIGDDIVIGLSDENTMPELLCGIVFNITDDYIDISVQRWKDEEENINNIRYYFKDNNKQFKNIYKIR